MTARPLQCFRVPLHDAPLHRYYLGQRDSRGRFVVSAVQISHPDAQLIARPAHVVMPGPARAQPVKPDAKRQAAKRCPRCRQMLLIEHFRTSAGTLRSFCAPCTTEYKQARRLRIKAAP